MYTSSGDFFSCNTKDNILKCFNVNFLLVGLRNALSATAIIITIMQVYTSPQKYTLVAQKKEDKGNENFLSAFVYSPYTFEKMSVQTFSPNEIYSTDVD